MAEWYTRTESIIGSDAVRKLQHSRVAVFGVGGVGGYTAEALARCGVGSIDLIDGDTVSDTNRNRQTVALVSTLGQPKAEVMARRILDINPECRVRCINKFYTPQSREEFDLAEYDFIADAIDMVTAKVCLIENAKAAGVPLVSCMGAGNKTDPTLFKCTDISKTSVCPLARIMRIELRKRGIEHQTVVFSTEPPASSAKNSSELLPGKHAVPGSLVFTVAAAGLLMAQHIVKCLTDGFGKAKQ